MGSMERTKMTKVTISRYWNNPQISTTVTDKGIALSITMADFAEALKQELGWKSLFIPVDRIIAKILAQVKEESSKVVQ